jgi:hypothetical protein
MSSDQPMVNAPPIRHRHFGEPLMRAPAQVASMARLKACLAGADDPAMD